MSSIEARLDKIESRIAVEELLNKYCHGFDGPDRELLRTLWAEDAVFDLGPAFGAPAQGIDGIMAKAEELWAAVPVMYHWMADAVIDVDGDTATAKTELDCFVVSREDGPTQVIGVYSDRFERVGGVWKFKHRAFDLQLWAPLKGWVATAGSKAEQTRI
ncbi:nuclear transport factor 2 family protein [Streptomyces sp. NPDC005435]|uniref:nuclear transport factor 2 family protein n=1 Tax=Streptomyces sp. NPDC005435 TaxID=3154464 RepID=UPI003455E3F7